MNEYGAMAPRSLAAAGGPPASRRSRTRRATSPIYGDRVAQEITRSVGRAARPRRESAGRRLHRPGRAAERAAQAGRGIVLAELVLLPRKTRDQRR